MNRPDRTMQIRPVRWAILILIITFTGAGQLLANDGEAALKRYALFVGANDGGSERVYLRYAETDALSMATVMKDIGGVHSADARVLLNPEAEELTRSFSEISNWVKETKSDAQRIEFILYYSGHSDEYGLLLKGANYPYRKLKDEITKIGADVHIAILDSCSSGSFTRLKGGQRQRPFLMDESVDTSGYAFLTSSSENEAAQESDEIEGSFFTHFLLTGLMGAADHTGNSQVSLTEAYSYASEQTLARTEQTLAGAQHPSYDMKLSGSGDLVLTDLRSAAAGMAISGDLAGRLFIRDNKGKLLAEINKDAGDPVTIALPPGYYTLTLENEDELSSTSVTIGYNQTQNLQPGQFQARDREWTTIRGNGQPIGARRTVEPAGADKELTRVPMELAMISVNGDELLVEGIAMGFIDSVNSVEGIQMGMITSLSGYLEGIQLAYLFGTVENNMNGVQVSGIFSTAEKGAEGAQVSGVFNSAGGEMSGIQIGGVFNDHSKGYFEGVQVGGVFSAHSDGYFEGAQISGVFNDHADGYIDGLQIGGVFNTSRGKMDGFQIGGVFNSSTGDLDGFQLAGVGNFQTGENMNGSQISGVLNNTSGHLQGTQVSGVLNKKRDLRGFQTGLINIADDVRGTQVGVLNISESYTKGYPIGLINVSRDGIHKLSSWSDSVNNIYAGFQLGTKNVYTIYAGGTSINDPWADVSLGIGTGLHFDLNALFVEGELWGKYFFEPDRIDNAEYWESEDHFVYPGVRAVAGFKIFRNLAVIGGFTADGWFPQIMDGDSYPMTENESVESFTLFDIDVEFVPRWFLGVRF